MINPRQNHDNSKDRQADQLNNNINNSFGNVEEDDFDNSFDNLMNIKHMEHTNTVEESWIRHTVDNIFRNKTKRKLEIKGNQMNNRDQLLTHYSSDHIKQLKHDIKQSVNNMCRYASSTPNKITRISLTSSDPVYRVHIKLLYDPDTTKEKVNHDHSRLMWGLMGKDLIKNYKYLPRLVKDEDNKKIKPIYRSDTMVWYPFSSYKTCMMRIALELNILDDLLFGKKIKKTLKTLSSEEKTTGLLGTDLFPDLSFVREYDSQYNTALIDIIKCNPKKGARPNKIFVSNLDNQTENRIYRFNTHGTKPEILMKAIDRVSYHIPLFYPKRIRWSSRMSFVKAQSFMKRQLERFWESTCMVAILSFAKHTKMLIKSTYFNKMMIADPWKTSDKYRSSYQYDEIIRAANRCGISINFLNRDVRDQAKGEGSCSLAAFARCIYVCMELQNIYKFNENILKNNKPSDIIDEDVLIKLFNEPLNDSVALISASVMKKNRSIYFDPDIISDF